MAAEFQQAVVDVLVAKTLRAAEEYKVKTIMVSGGVSANSALRAAFANSKSQITNSGALFPPPALTGDNAAMIAMAGYINYTLGKRFKTENLGADANMRLGE
jgi:N6-L-threonylcarbamoyladenine synthase